MHDSFLFMNIEQPYGHTTTQKGPCQGRAIWIKGPENIMALFALLRQFNVNAIHDNERR